MALVLIVLMVVAASLWVFSRRKSVHRLTLHAYYGHVQHVQNGMPVCVDGVQVGSVADVIVRPELGDRPVEVILNIPTPYDLRIPSGSAAQVVEPGVFRATVVEIDTRGTSGPPLADGSKIEGRESADDQVAHALGVVVKSLADQSKRQTESPPPGPSRNKQVDHGH